MTTYQQDDRGDIVLGWLSKVVVVIGAVGVIGFDLIAVGQAHVQADDRASTAARAAADAYQSSHSAQTAYDAGVRTLTDGDTIETQTFAVATDGAITLRLHHHASTLLMKRIGPLADRADAVATGTAHPER